MNFDAVYNLLKFNSTFQTLEIYIETVFGTVQNIALSLKSTLVAATRSFFTASSFEGSFVPIIEFTELQWALLKIILLIFFINIVLIGIYWRKYGDIITDRFIRPSTLKEIEELKLSVAKLKLPKEHSPRI